MRPFERIAAIMFAFMLPALAGCSTNPATGEQNFTAFMSPEEEITVGRQEHPKILEQFGGAYDHNGVAAYIDPTTVSSTRRQPNASTFSRISSRVIHEPW